MSKKEIRKLRADELEGALGLIWEVFTEFEAPDYTEEGIDEFWNFIDPEYMLMQLGEGRMTFWGAFEDDRLVGVCAFRGLGHISMLFVDADYHRRGIATALLKKAAADCKALDPALDEITVNSSPYAVPFYEAVGFKKVSEMREENGIKFVPMKIKAE